MKKHILIVDDDLELTGLIKKFLENHNFKVSSFHHPKKALDALSKKHTFELVILEPCFVLNSEKGLIRLIKSDHLRKQYKNLSSKSLKRGPSHSG